MIPPMSIPLAAGDLGVIVKIALLLVFFIGPLVYKLFKSAENGESASRRRANQVPDRPRPQAQRPPGPVREGDPQIRQELDQFLAEARRRKQGLPARMERRPEQVPQAVAVEAPVLAEVVAAPMMAGEAQRRLSTFDVDPLGEIERVSHLGEEVSESTEHMEAHLHEVFDHRIGSLGPALDADVAAAADDSPADKVRRQVAETPTAAAGFAAMLRNPQDVRKAIVLNEILSPPAHRWR